jgi:hypothetical protein
MLFAEKKNAEFLIFLSYLQSLIYAPEIFLFSSIVGIISSLIYVPVTFLNAL